MSDGGGDGCFVTIIAFVVMLLLMRACSKQGITVIIDGTPHKLTIKP